MAKGLRGNGSKGKQQQVVVTFEEGTGQVQVLFSKVPNPVALLNMAIIQLAQTAVSESTGQGAGPPAGSIHVPGMGVITVPKAQDEGGDGGGSSAG